MSKMHNPALMQHDAAYYLHMERFHAYTSPRSLSTHRIGFKKQIVKRFSFGEIKRDPDK